MELTGKCKLEFEKWLLIWLKDNVAWDVENPQQEDVDHFYTFPLAMQYGVYVDFFYNIGIHIELSKWDESTWQYFVSDTLESTYNEMGDFYVLEELRTDAIMDADILFNQRE